MVIPSKSAKIVAKRFRPTKHAWGAAIMAGLYASSPVTQTKIQALEKTDSVGQVQSFVTPESGHVITTIWQQFF